MLSELMAVDDGLSDWVVGFIESVSRHREQGLDLSPRQAKKLEEIWDDRF